MFEMRKPEKSECKAAEVTAKGPPGRRFPACPKVAIILLTLRIENNSKFVRGKKRTILHVESFCLDQYEAERRPNGEYVLKIPYDTDEELDEAVNELLTDIASGADDQHCLSESEARMEGTDRHW